MRGSPLLRTLVVLALLAAAGLALARLTRPGPAAPIPPGPSTDRAEISGIEAGYRLTLSAEAEEVTLESSGTVHHALEGRLRLDPDHPVLFLKIRWKDHPAGHRFARLNLDLPGKDTLLHYFEAPGDIDDVWEIDLP